MTADPIQPARRMAALLEMKYGPPDGQGWSPRLRARFGHQSPDDWYEATLFELVGPDTAWLDVGCGRKLFPANPEAARRLSATCRFLMGVDPSPNGPDNPFVHDRAQCGLEDFATDRRFDLVTLRMVAEHVLHPEALVAALRRLTLPGGRVVIYTVPRFSPVSLVAAATPMAVHHVVKRLLWETDERDSFPVAYRMNTRRRLRRLFEREEFEEEHFRFLDDCRSFGRWKPRAMAELAACAALRRGGLRYPEACLLGIYRRRDAAEG
jgi:SAM-dependent methyltransferase